MLVSCLSQSLLCDLSHTHSQASPYSDSTVLSKQSSLRAMDSEFASLYTRNGGGGSLSLFGNLSLTAGTPIRSVCEHLPETFKEVLLRLYWESRASVLETWRFCCANLALISALY